MEAVSPTFTYVATANLQGVTDPTSSVVDSMQATIPGVGVACFQELGRVRVRDRLSRLLGVRQAPGLAAGGVGLAWARSEFTVRQSGVDLMCGPVRGEMRSRFLVWAELVAEDGHVTTFASTHRPLPRTSLRAARDRFDTNLRRWITDHDTTPNVIGLDANASIVPVGDLGYEFVHLGVDGFILPRTLAFTGPFRLPPTLSDHLPIAIGLRP